MMNLSLNKKLLWLIVGVSALLFFFTYKFFTDWRWTVPNNSEVIISLKRTECFGFCPVYEITLYDNGTVVYEGYAHVGVRGFRKANIGAETVQQLAAELDKAGYFLLNDSYNNQTYTDAPSIITYVKIGNKEKQIGHYGGDTSAPEELSKMEKLIDDIANSNRWVNACSFTYPSSCRLNLVFWVMVAIPLAIAVAIAWSFIRKSKVMAGMILAEIPIVLLWGFVLLLLNNKQDMVLTRVEWDTVVFYRTLAISEFIAALLIGLFLIKWHKQKAL